MSKNMLRITVTAVTAVVGGDLIEYGDIVGVAATDAEVGDLVTLYVGGEYTFNKLASTTYTDGEKIGVDSGELSTTAGSKMLGYVVRSTDETVMVLISQGEDLA